MSSLESLTEAHFSNLVQRVRTAGVRVEVHHMPGCGVLVVPSQRHVAISLEPSLHQRYRMLCEAARRLHLSYLLVDDPFAASLADTLGVNARPVPWPNRGDRADDSLEISLEISIDVSLDALRDAASTPIERRVTRQVDLEPIAALRSSGGSVTLGDALLDACGDTLRDDTRQVSRESLARHLAAAAAAAAADTRVPSEAPRPVPPAPPPQAAARAACEICVEPRYGTLLDLELCRGHLYAAIQGRLLPAEVRLLRRHHACHPELSPAFYDDDGEPRR